MLESGYLVETFSRICKILQRENKLNVEAKVYRIQGYNKADSVIEQKSKP